MDFRTEIKLQPGKSQINYQDKILTIGSCFAENIAKKLKHFKFNVCSNPFGVLYNPVSILNSIELLTNEKIFDESDLINNQDEYHSFYHHSDFSHHSQMQVLQNINNSLEETREFIKSVNFVTITLGTSWIYIFKKTEQIVSNCHKIPSKEFERKRLSSNEVAWALKEIIEKIKSVNPEVKIIITVSPIRHWKDGAVENMISKSTLILGLQEVLGDSVFYFPSYEIVMDDLRDYRFFESDMLHPNQQAIDYIWQKFCAVYFAEKTKQEMKSVEKIVNAFNHRPRNTESEKHQAFLKKNLEMIDEIRKINQDINFDREKEYFNSLLI